MRTQSILFQGTLLALSLGAALSLSACKKKATCVPLSCQDEGTNCGQIVDSCGNISDCGVCAVAGETCGALGKNLCGVGTCDPVTCVEANQTVGLLEDGCGSVVDCGVQGTGGVTGVGGSPASGGTVATGGGAATGGAGGSATGGGSSTGGSSGGISPLGSGVMGGNGVVTGQYSEANVRRDGVNYMFIANGWGPGWNSHTIKYNGTSLDVTLNGSSGSSGEPAGFPTVFCGNYSGKSTLTAKPCGLPVALNSGKKVKTGAVWNGAGGTYNMSWDIWLGDGTNLQSYLMVWLRDPPGAQPAGGSQGSANVGGADWVVWSGSVNGKPIVNYVRAEGQDLKTFEFDVMDFYNHSKNYQNLPGSQINSVAVGFEVWGNVSNVKIDDFYVSVE